MWTVSAIFPVGNHGAEPLKMVAAGSLALEMLVGGPGPRLGWEGKVAEEAEEEADT